MTIKELSKKIRLGNFSFLSWFKNNKASSVHPSEVAKVISGLPADVAIKAYKQLPAENQLKVFPYLDIPDQQNLIKNLEREKSVYLLNHLSSDDLITFLSSLRGIELSRYLDYLDEKNKKAVHNLLGYPDNSVARLIDTDFSTIKKEMTVAEAIEYLRNFHKDTDAANVIYVVDDHGRLIDDIPVRRFILNDPRKKVEDIMDGFYVSLHISDKKETAVQKFKEYDRVVLPVTNDDNVLLGVITIDDVIDVAEEKDTKQIQKFGGMESLDYPYVDTPILTLIRKRAGWLIVLFLGEMFTATAMAHYGDELGKAEILAMFLPLIISSGGNSGSQAATLIIRAMAVNELTLKNWFYVMRREIFSGLSLGIILGVIGFFRITLWQKVGLHDYGTHWVLVGVTILFSLIGVVMWGTLSGAVIPMILKKLKLDPATSSAPFVATLVDVTGLIIYFTIAAVILKGTLL